MDTGIKVGELAKRTGLTVRTLHHYDEIGLLSPAERTPSGHRLYGPAELERLQQIASLRHLGFTLDQIRDCLERPEYSLRYVLELHIDRVNRELEQGARLRALLTSLKDRVEQPGGASVEEVTEAVDATIRFSRYYSDEQLETLAKRRASIGDDGMAEAQGEWSRLFEEFGRAMDAGLPPDDPAVGALADRAAALVEGFTGGDPGIARSLSTLYETEGGPSVMAKHGMALPDGLWAYMTAARKERGGR